MVTIIMNDYPKFKVQMLKILAYTEYAKYGQHFILAAEFCFEVEWKFYNTGLVYNS